jgi:hypothetical protein
VNLPEWTSEIIAIADAAALVGKRVRFAHTPDREEFYTVVTGARNGMVELDGWVGEFAPHLFAVHP